LPRSLWRTCSSSRATPTLYTRFFSDRADAAAFFLQCSRDWIQPFSADLRKILTGLEIARPSGAKPLSCGEVVIGKTLPGVQMNVFWCDVKTKGQSMAKQTSNKAVGQAEQECSFSTTTIAALLFLAAKFPHRQFNSSELCVLSGIGRTAMSQIKNAADSPFSLGKCTLQRLDGWLAKHPGFKQQ
jgi:hypothetical protein